MNTIINGHDYKAEVNEYLAHSANTEHPLQWLMRARIVTSFFQGDAPDAKAEIMRLSDEGMKS